MSIIFYKAKLTYFNGYYLIFYFTLTLLTELKGNCELFENKSENAIFVLNYENNTPQNIYISIYIYPPP